MHHFLPRRLLASAVIAVALFPLQADELSVAPVSWDHSFPAIAYGARANDNAVARLVERLAAGATLPAPHPVRGHLDGLLQALDISPSSQVLVFSRTSLQSRFISAARPRAIYFNDHTYVAWVQGSDDLEVLTIDAQRGPVFFAVRNVIGAPPAFEREALRCMVCHDSAATRPGGHPKVMLLSSPVAGQVNPPLRIGPAEVTHATALEDRWGGWFVTGSLGAQLHVGNLPLEAVTEPELLGIHNRSNLPGLASHLDTRPYLTDKSDVVALLVLEHQASVQNLLTRLRYEASVLPSAVAAPRWSAVDRPAQAVLQPTLDALAAALTFQDERRLLGRIAGNAGFEAAYMASGPFDGQGRSLRQLDLRRRLYRHPLSPLVHSAQFDALPVAARDYLYGRIAATLREASGDAELDADRRAALEILAQTSPGYAAWSAALAGAPAASGSAPAPPTMANPGR